MIFVLTKQEKDQNRNILVGNIFISNLLAYLLIDSGVTHSFISLKFIYTLGVLVEFANFPLVVSITSGNMLNTGHDVKIARIEIDIISLEMKLYVIDMNEFDVILGMHWLSKNCTKILCFERRSGLSKTRRRGNLCMTTNGPLPHVISTTKAR